MSMNKKALFITAMNAVLRMHEAIKRLDKIGFDIERGAAKELCTDLDKTMDEIGNALGLERSIEGDTTVSWWMEGMMMGDPYSATDRYGRNWTPKTPAELWNLIQVDGEVAE